MGLFTSIGATLGFSTAVTAASSISAATAVGLGATALAGAAGYGAYSMMSGGKKPDQQQQFQMPATPAAPKMSDASKLAQQQAMDRRRAAARSDSVKTNPLGIKDEAEVARKKLLGG